MASTTPNVIPAPIVISLDGNIGAGKTTLLKACEGIEGCTIVHEPVASWLQMKNEHGESLLELFYKDKRRWGYTFQK
jgi:deoxyadenosine/deoxycytidine kinase